MKGSFKFSPTILIRLGEELVPNPTDGLLELVKNSYDADASYCKIQITNEGISIQDDGDGMSATDLIEGWLLIGGSRKSSSQLTRKNRTPVGNKGLGRLAALRLGDKVIVRSRPKSNPKVEYTMEIPWREVDRSDFVEEKQFTIKETPTKQTHGTEIILDSLRAPLSEAELRDFARSLVLLSDPFESNSGFQATLVTPGFSSIDKLARQNFFEDADYHLVASIDESGSPSVKVLDWQDRVRYSAKPQDFQKSSPYRTPPATFDLWSFKLSRENFSAKNSDVKDVQRWLAVRGGVHLYHNNMRVRPFGEPGHDWLEMDRKRASNPEERPSTNNSIGVIKINDSGQYLTQKTDRSGFVENDSYRELRRFATDCLNWMGTRRLGEAELRREKKRTSSSGQVLAARKSVRELISKTIPKNEAKEIFKALQTFESANQKEALSLREDLQLYRSMATAGSTSAVFAHESQKPLTQILAMAKSIRLRGEKLLGDIFGRQLEEPITLLVGATKALQLFSQLPLNLLKREKRRNEVVDLKSSATELIGYLKPFFTDAKIKLELHTKEKEVLVSGSRALVESILANLTLNSLRAFDASNARILNRIVEIRLLIEDGSAILKVLDNGPGIQGIGLEDIWLPGRTTSPDGTGFGLTIVRDSVSDMRGRCEVAKVGELGGAEFKIIIPLAN